MSIWKTLIVTFGLIFFAELGDKTQLTVMTLSAQTKTPIPVFVGATAALALSSLLGAIFGSAITRVVPTNLIHTIAGLGFIAIGILLVIGKL